MELFVSRGKLEDAQKRARRCTRCLRLLIFAALALFIVLCLLTRTANARIMLWMMLISMTLLGWACICYYLIRVRPVRAAAGHLRTIMSGEPEEYEGVFHLSPKPERIPGSVQIRVVTLTDGERTKRLHLDESLTDRAPAEGSRVRIQAVHQFVTGIEVLETADGQRKAACPGAAVSVCQVAKSVFHLIPLFFLWALLVTVVGGFVFNRITETAPKNKIVIYVDCGVREAAELASDMEKNLADPVRMVKVHPFDYSLFGQKDLANADIYIVPVSDTEKYRRLFVPLPEELREAEGLLVMEGEPYGIPVYDPEGGVCAAADYFEYDTAEKYYLFFGNHSLHLAGHENAVDHQAVDAALFLMELD